jgi:hypothetical protein
MGDDQGGPVDDDAEVAPPRDRVAWLKGRLDAGTLARARLEVVARLGDADAAAALGGAPAPDEVDLYLAGDATASTLSVVEQVVALAHALEGLVRWWRRGAQPPAEQRFLDPVAQAVTAATAWVEGPEAPRAERALEAGRHVVRLVEVVPPDGGGIDPSMHERAFVHLARAAGSVAYVCGPPRTPFRAPTPWDPAPAPSRKTEEAERRDRLVEAWRELALALRGRAELEALPRDDGFEGRADACARAVRRELQRTLAARLLA